MEQDSFYDEIVRKDVKLFITNVPNTLLDYKSRKFLVEDVNVSCCQGDSEEAIYSEEKSSSDY